MPSSHLVDSQDRSRPRKMSHHPRRRRSRWIISPMKLKSKWDVLEIQRDILCELFGMMMMLSFFLFSSETSLEDFSLPIMVTVHPAASNIGRTVSLTILLAFPFPPTGLTSTRTLFLGVTSIVNHRYPSLRETHLHKQPAWQSRPIVPPPPPD